LFYDEKLLKSQNTDKEKWNSIHYICYLKRPQKRLM
jgi:hypothetical protein